MPHRPAVLAFAAILAGCTAAPAPETPVSTAATPTTSATTTALKCSTFLRDGITSIAVPDSLLRDGCTTDTGDHAAVETYACLNGTVLNLVDHWAITGSGVVDFSKSDPAFFGPDKLRTWCLKGLR